MTEEKKYTIAIDFDGVIHSYTSGWHGHDTALDPPVPGAAEFLAQALERGYDVAVCSTRAETVEGRIAIRDYLLNMIPAYLERRIRVEAGKPKALVYIDDRGWRFDGTFPSLDDVDLFTPWNKVKDEPGRADRKHVSNVSEDRAAQLRKIQDECLEVFLRKNTDYGDSFAEDGPVGVIIRLGDKIKRMKSITRRGISLVNDESLRDTLLDLHNYAAMAVMLMDEQDAKEE